MKFCYYCGVNPRTDREACTECAGRWKKPEILSVKDIEISGTIALVDTCGYYVAGVPLTGGVLEGERMPMQAGQTWKNPKGIHQKVKVASTYNRMALMYPANGTWGPNEWATVALTVDLVPEDPGWVLVS